MALKPAVLGAWRPGVWAALQAENRDGVTRGGAKAKTIRHGRL